MTDNVRVEKSNTVDADAPGLCRPQQATADTKNIAAPDDNGPDTSRYVRQLEKRIDEKDDVIGLLKGQLVAKDQQITDLSTRFGNLSDRFADTQKLLGAMQRMFAPLLGQADPYANPEPRDMQDTSAPV